MSSKDKLPVVGFRDTAGFATNLQNPPMTWDCPLWAMLKDAGAVCLVKSNVPVGMMAIEGINNIWGWAKNPYNHERSCGGSSSGEAGLLAAHCVPLAFGTDIGGSVRIPAAFCGAYSIRVTSSRSSFMNSMHSDGRIVNQSSTSRVLIFVAV